MPDETNNSSKPILYFHHAGSTDIGQVRDHNEDDYVLPVDFDAKTLNQKGYLYVLADGMGGHQKGEVASAVTIDVIPSKYYDAIAGLDENNFEDVIIKTLTDAIEAANVRVMKATEGGGTTVVSALFYANWLVTMNVGDSRAYLLRDDELRLISRDHSLVSRLVEMGKITEDEALSHPRRNVLYQALGQGSDLEIHISTETLKVGDIVILCSDGLWGEITDTTLKQVLRSAGSPQASVQALISLANQAGGPDNITVIVVQVSDKEKLEPHEMLKVDNYFDQADTTPLPLPPRE